MQSAQVLRERSADVCSPSKRAQIRLFWRAVFNNIHVLSLLSQLQGCVGEQRLWILFVSYDNCLPTVKTYDWSAHSAVYWLDSHQQSVGYMTSKSRREWRNANNRRFDRGFERISDSIIWIWIWSLTVKPEPRIIFEEDRRAANSTLFDSQCTILHGTGNSIQFVIGAACIRTVITAAGKRLVAPFPWQQAPSLWQQRLTVIQMITSGTEAWY